MSKRKLRKNTIYLVLFICGWLVLSSCTFTSATNSIDKNEVINSQSVKVLENEFPTGFSKIELLNENEWIIISNGYLWRTNDKGKTWNKVIGAKINSSLCSLDFINERIGFFLTNNKLIKTFDGGKTWTNLQDLNEIIRDENQTLTRIYFFDEQLGWAIGFSFSATSGTEGKIWHTKDGGLTWKEQSITNQAQISVSRGNRWDLRDVHFLNEKVGWAAGYGILIYTEDGGQNWKIKNEIQGIYEEIVFQNFHTGWAIEKMPEASIITNDGGKNWNVIKFPSSQDASSLYLYKNRAFLVNSSGLLLESSIKDFNWKKAEIENQQWNSLINESIFGNTFIGISFDGYLISGLFIPEKQTVISITSKNNGKTWQ